MAAELDTCVADQGIDSCMLEEVVNAAKKCAEVVEEEIDECLLDRKYWCFLLSSIFTFLAGIFIVLIWRLFEYLFCRHREATEMEIAAQKKLAQQQQQQAGLPPGSAKNINLNEGNFVTEAKDWAGELISGQTTTGRILVSYLYLYINIQRKISVSKNDTMTI